MYYNITIGGERSTGTPNLYYVINGRPLIDHIHVVYDVVCVVIRQVGYVTCCASWLD